MCHRGYWKETAKVFSYFPPISVFVSKNIGHRKGSNEKISITRSYIFYHALLLLFNMILFLLFQVVHGMATRSTLNREVYKSHPNIWFKTFLVFVKIELRNPRFMSEVTESSEDTSQLMGCVQKREKRESSLTPFSSQDETLCRNNQRRSRLN